MMRRVFLLGIASFSMLFAASASYGETTIIGFWEEVGVSDSLVLYAQDGNIVYVIGTYAINGQPRLWHGFGQREGNTITYSTEITLGPAQAKGKTGKHILTISSDGRTLAGNAIASDGKSSSLTMKKKSSPSLPS